MINYLEKLNDTFLELLNDLVAVFPDDPDFHMYRAVCSSALNIDDTFIYYVIQRKLITYERQILERDELFLMNTEVDIPASSSARVKANITTILNKLRYAWSSISPTDKNIIWKYFGVIIALYHRVLI
jgi:hypothetical protein